MYLTKILSETNLVILLLSHQMLISFTIVNSCIYATYNLKYEILSKFIEYPELDLKAWLGNS